jgi:predicted nucleic acid-binding protein
VSRIYWDSMLFIYILEGNPTFGPKTRAILNGMIKRGDSLCTSVFTVGEVLTGPRKAGSQSGVDAIKSFFASGSVDLLPFTSETADRCSAIRAGMRVRQADAIHLATASAANVDLFFTNDGPLRKLPVPGIRFFADLDGKVF